MHTSTALEVLPPTTTGAGEQFGQNARRPEPTSGRSSPCTCALCRYAIPHCMNVVSIEPLTAKDVALALMTPAQLVASVKACACGPSEDCDACVDIASCDHCGREATQEVTDDEGYAINLCDGCRVHR